MQSRGREPKTFLSILGAITINRSAYECISCDKTRFTAGEKLDIVDTVFSPGCRRLNAYEKRRGRVLKRCRIQITIGRKHDGPTFSYVVARGRLQLFDLAVASAKETFLRIHSMGGFFVSRFKGPTASLQPAAFIRGWVHAM